MVSARVLLASLAALPFVLGLPSCSGGGGGGGGGSSATTAEFLLSSSGEAELFSLCTDVTALRLTRADGGATANLLAAPVTLEFVGMADLAEWLTKVEIEPATYTAVEFDFDRDSIHALSPAGSEVMLELADETWQTEFDRPLVVKRGDAGRMEVVLDLNESITGEILPAPPQFLPAGDVYILGDGDGERGIDEVDGLVVEISLPERTFGLEVFRDDMMQFPMGVLTVFVQPDTVLIDDNEMEFPNQEAFFASLRVGLTVVEVHGALDDMGDFLADRVEIEDQGGQRPPAVEIEGMVLFVFDEDEASADGVDGQFILLIQEIEEGADIADPVLAGIGNPSAIDVIWDSETVFVGPHGEVIDSDQLSAGQMVDVAFDVFRAPPFLAVEIELGFEAGERCFEGIIQEVDELSGEIVIAIDSDDHEDYDDGLDDARELTVDLSNAEIVLGIRDRPSLEVADLVTGMKIKACGTLERQDGDGETDEDRVVLVATSAKLKPGDLHKGIPGATDLATCSFTLEAGQIKKTFGDDVTSAPFNVLISDDARFRDDADSKEEFYQLFDFLEGDEYLDIKLKGIGSGEPNEIVAYELKVKVRADNGHGGGGDDDDDDDGGPDDDDDDDGGDDDE